MYRVITDIFPIISSIHLTIWHIHRTLNYMNLSLRPTTRAEWFPYLANCYATRRSLYRGRNDFFPLYIPPMLKWTTQMHEPGDELFTFLTLIRDLYLSQACAPDNIFGGPLSDLETKAKIKSALITHICDIVERLVMAPAGSFADRTYDIVQILNYELKDLEQTGLTQTADFHQSVEGITRTCESYLMACVVHPEIDIDGSNAEWMLHLFQDQPNMILVVGDLEESPEPLYALVQLLRQCFSSKEYDFVRIFEAFGRWTVTMTVDHLRNYENYRDSETRFLADVIEDLINPLSRIPLDLRKAMCDINLRSMYREMFYKMREILEYGPDIISFDVLNYKLWQWALKVIMQSSLEPHYKVRIGIWMWIRGDDILGSEYSLSVPLPGQSVLSRLPLEDLIITERLPWAMQEPAEDLEDVEFEAVGPLLDPSAYAETLDNSGDWMDELCIVCLERLVDDRSSPAKILVCGHLSHWDCLSKLINGISEWSNKCPLCRRKIWSPRQKRALTESVVNDEVGDGFYHLTAEYFQDSDVDDLVTNMEELGFS
jgi:hypothetical protein